MKNTIFLSHSSTDKVIVSKINNFINCKTNGMFEIFQSSDGKSIPFGTNWVHSIESGLNKCKIMFVFISPNSINNNWMHFESGFAYSKKIKVIPIGIKGVDISKQNPPLNLLQGFNIKDNISLSNLFEVMNREFDLSIKTTVTETEYFELFTEESSEFDNETIKYIKSIFIDGRSSTEIGFASLIEKYLIKNKFDYFAENYDWHSMSKTKIEASGFVINFLHFRDYDSFRISIDPYSLNESINKIRMIFKEFRDIIRNLLNISVELSNHSISIDENYKIVNRVKGGKLRILQNGKLNFNDEVSFKIDYKNEYDDDGESFRGNTIIEFSMTIEDFELNKILSTLELLIENMIIKYFDF